MGSAPTSPPGGEAGGGKGRKGKEVGGREEGRAAGGSGEPQAPRAPSAAPGATLSPLPGAARPGEGVIAGRGHGTGMLISVRLVKLNCQSFSFQ